MAQGHSVIYSQWFILGFSLKADTSQIGRSPSADFSLFAHVQSMKQCKATSFSVPVCSPFLSHTFSSLCSLSVSL